MKKKASFKKLVKKFIGKNTDESDRILLREEDFKRLYSNFSERRTAIEKMIVELEKTSEEKFKTFLRFLQPWKAYVPIFAML